MTEVPSRASPLDDDILTDRELRAVLLALAHGRGGRAFDDEQTARVVDWAEAARIDSAILGRVLAGDVSIDVRPDGELVFASRQSLARKSLRD